MPIYRCCFKDDIDFRSEGDVENDEWWVTEDISAKSAAEGYAEYAFHDRDMWEASAHWDGGNSVIVEDEDGNQHSFEITVESVPVFSAKKI